MRFTLGDSYQPFQLEDPWILYSQINSGGPWGVRNQIKIIFMLDMHPYSYTSSRHTTFIFLIWGTVIYNAIMDRILCIQQSRYHTLHQCLLPSTTVSSLLPILTLNLITFTYRTASVAFDHLLFLYYFYLHPIDKIFCISPYPDYVNFIKYDTLQIHSCYEKLYANLYFSSSWIEFYCGYIFFVCLFCYLLRHDGLFSPFRS